MNEDEAVCRPAATRQWEGGERLAELTGLAGVRDEGERGKPKLAMRVGHFQLEKSRREFCSERM